MKPDEIMLSGPWFDETNIDKLPGYKRFNVHTKKRRWTFKFYGRF